MFTNWLINKLIPKSKKNSREAYGLLGGIVGIVVNIILFVVKFFIGTITNSVAITADAFNNLSDMGSAVVTIIGFKIADKPADKEHPFGHGRGEYIAGLVVSFAVLLVGFQFLKESYDRIKNPSPLVFDYISFIVLIISVFTKVWLGMFNKVLSRKISSGTLNATSFDSFSDVIITSTVALSLVASKYTTFPIDGYSGIIVSLFILFAGYNLVKDTISPLLGEAPDPELVKSIISEVLSYKPIMGTHDLIVHSYGAGKHIATIHAEIPSDVPIMAAHEIIDKAENEISKKLGIHLVIHMDPVNLNDVEINETKEKIDEILSKIPSIKSYHDFRIIGENKHKNIVFDAVVDNSFNVGYAEEITEQVNEKIKEIYPQYNVIINFDKDYTQHE
ncbi:cation diffusion facilitator family transporter [Fervidicella metallireducens AeB]|uniref:Cation diffusion facilitator family transporter n=1 Tax=Fervidicella metallireducens AeB TaxID=1403537 RepID=A0A017RXR6_9CLOT|nr:cation diffusion facilitator family transporter [Fervidicella metallireducens]EYE89381.1 cation diffusion facilitator family transporter [Fervidicella metallireducens AeB]